MIENDDRWWEDHDNVQVLLTFMADNPLYDKEAMAYAHEKPWKYTDDYEQAVREQAEDVL